jgi:hypothetical protein
MISSKAFQTTLDVLKISSMMLSDKVRICPSTSGE